jgi:hypothetical protein
MKRLLIILTIVCTIGIGMKGFCFGSDVVRYHAAVTKQETATTTPILQIFSSEKELEKDVQEAARKVLVHENWTKIVEKINPDFIREVEDNA